MNTPEEQNAASREESRRAVLKRLGSAVYIAPATLALLASRANAAS